MTYKSVLTAEETQVAIKFIKDKFQHNLARRLNLKRVTAPVFVRADSGLNDDLNGVERKVSFTARGISGQLEVVQSLAKWKRVALTKYKFRLGEGLYTDMNAIRPDEKPDRTHSVFVDQWDWEKVIDVKDRNTDYLKKTVKSIVAALDQTAKQVAKAFPTVDISVTKDVYFVTSQELEDMYPSLTPAQREQEITRQHKTVFVMQIGGLLKSGAKHDDRAPDYDDWKLNGDLLVWNDVLGEAMELSSMGIRVDADSLVYQLIAKGCDEKLKLPYHSDLVSGKLPYTIGGGIGQSRLCMFLLKKRHIGEVQVSVWPDDQLELCAEENITLL
ncbi:MAG TPA: aspartate--ammonia ligase [Candidatus Limihabitans stercoravium]|nr:aspartate--ammonia ligase [Candidatus Limihabitans stercoravium]